MDERPSDKPKIGRPLANVDGEQVYKMASIGSTQQEIADYFGVARATISERFRREFELGKATSKRNLRGWQFRRAKQGSDALLIHLGKVYLDQNDKAGRAEDLDDAKTRDEHGDIEP